MLKPRWSSCNIAIILIVLSFTYIVIIAFYFNYSVILVVSIRKRVLMGFLPWILFRGFITFGLIIMGIVFTINNLKGDSIGGLFSTQNQEGNKGNVILFKPISIMITYQLFIFALCKWMLICYVKMILGTLIFNQSPMLILAWQTYYCCGSLYFLLDGW